METGDIARRMLVSERTAKRMLATLLHTLGASKHYYTTHEYTTHEEHRAAYRDFKGNPARLTEMFPDEGHDL